MEKVIYLDEKRKGKELEPAIETKKEPPKRNFFREGFFDIMKILFNYTPRSQVEADLAYRRGDY
ncbi:MAG: hypothetical protein PVJ67_01685 [Candidatus Pacearchaeota archaeon]|jgi:hypothetical protein